MVTDTTLETVQPIAYSFQARAVQPTPAEMKLSADFRESVTTPNPNIQKQIELENQNPNQQVTQNVEGTSLRLGGLEMKASGSVLTGLIDAAGSLKEDIADAKRPIDNHFAAATPQPGTPYFKPPEGIKPPEHDYQFGLG